MEPLGVVLACFDASANLKPKTTFRLKTLEEHRFATRFEEKKITPRTWRKALRDALRKIQTRDRIQLAEALYLLLEIAALRPRGCDLAKVFLNAGSIYLVFDHLDEAVRLYQQCLHVDSTSWRASFNLGIALAKNMEFVFAKTVLENAALMCPPDVAEQVQDILNAIHTIQERRNARAFRETEKARAFTVQYLETLRLVTNRLRPATSTRSHADEAIDSSRLIIAPILFDSARGWNGPIAELLHDLYIYASFNNIVVNRELRRLDPSGDGVVALSAFVDIFQRVRGVPITSEQLSALHELFPDSAVRIQLLVPNPESLQILDEMHQYGWFHAGMSWQLTTRRLSRSPQSRSGGLWRWMELSMQGWVNEIADGVQMTAKARLSLKRLLERTHVVTPFDFPRQSSLITGRLSPLAKTHRLAIYTEIEALITSIRDEACITIQMFFRRVSWRMRRISTLVPKINSILVESNSRCQLLNDALVDEKTITQALVDVTDDLINAVVILSRQQRYLELSDRCIGEVPKRTEDRHCCDN